MEQQRNCYVFVYNGYADWEPALARYGLHHFSDFAVTTFSNNGAPVRSGSNLSMAPYTFLDALHPGAIDLLILPGGTALRQNDPALHGILPLLRYMAQQHKPLAALCGAAALPVHSSMPDQVKHTGNALPHLPMATPEYQADHLYGKGRGAGNRNVITAGGTLPAAFAESSFHHFNLPEHHDFRFWFGCFQAAGAPRLEAAAPFHFFHRRFSVTRQEMPALIREMP
ncbi:MAG TPA: DJ-1/PfpI family protein, partial [Chitinophaga sp.]